MSKPLPYNKTRKTFRTLFIVSTSLSLFIILLVVVNAYLKPLQAPPGPQTEPNVIEQVVNIGGIVTILASCITSVASFIGFISTLILGWRKEARDAKASELERRRLEIELEKQKIELSKLKAEGERKRKSDK